MTTKTSVRTISVEISDLSRQKRLKKSQVDVSMSVGELIESVLGPLRLSPLDSVGRSLTYRAFRERDGRHLHAAEKIGDAIQDNDRLTLQPNIDAGSQ